jgi:hypothetical protein
MEQTRSAGLAVLAWGLFAAATPCLAQGVQANTSDQIELPRADVRNRRQEFDRYVAFSYASAHAFADRDGGIASGRERSHGYLRAGAWQTA